MINGDMTDQERFITFQYNRYKPRLDYMVEKYGEEFTIDDYGFVSSGKHPSWNIDVCYVRQQECYMDNYIILLRQNEMQQIMEGILLEIYGQCKVIVCPEWYAPVNSTKDTTADELLRAGLRGDANCIGVYCYTSRPPENRDRDFERAVRAIVERGYGLRFQMTYANEEIFSQITSQNAARYSADPKRFFCQTFLAVRNRLDRSYTWQEGQL